MVVIIKNNVKKPLMSLFKRKKCFPHLDNSKLLSKLKIDKVGEYSISIPDDADYTSDLIMNHITAIRHIELENILKNSTNSFEVLSIHDDIIITDATAGVGGNTISFSKHFNYINAIEIDKRRYDFLVNNCRIYKCDNITFYQDNFLKIISKIDQDVIFIDPPWGGKNYKLKDKITLNISDQSLEYICNKLLDNKYAKLIVLKLPINYDLEFLKSSINRCMSIYSIKKMIIVCLS